MTTNNKVSVNGGYMSQIQTNTPSKATTALSAMVSMPDVQERFKKMLGNKAAGFLSSLLTLYNSKEELQKCRPETILSSAAIAASLDLPINQNLGFAWIVGYKDKATFQIGAKGITQLAQRSGKMKSIVVTEVYEGEIREFDRFTETIIRGERVSDKVVGYYASFELINGFQKKSYWTVEEVTKHAKRFSKTFAYPSSPWHTDFDAMAMKTVLKNLLSNFAPLTIDMQMGLEADVEDKTLMEVSEETAKAEVETIEVEAEKPKRKSPAKKAEAKPVESMPPAPEPPASEPVKEEAQPLPFDAADDEGIPLPPEPPTDYCEESEASGFEPTAESKQEPSDIDYSQFRYIYEKDGSEIPFEEVKCLVVDEHWSSKDLAGAGIKVERRKKGGDK